MEKRTILLGLLMTILCIVEASQKREKRKVVRLKRNAEDEKSAEPFKNAITQAVEKYAQDVAKTNKAVLDRWSIQGMPEGEADNNASAMEINFNAINYDPAEAKGEGKTDDGVVLYTNIFCNTQKRQNISAIISKTLNRTATFSWQMDETKFAGLDVELDLPVPEDLQNMAEFSTSANLKDKTRVEASTVDTFNVMDHISVPAKTVTKAIWILSERKTTFPFKIEAIIKGDIVIWFKTPVNGKLYQVHPMKSIDSIKSPDFVLKPDGALMMIIKGQFKGIRGLATNLRTKSHPLKNTPCESSGKLFKKPVN